MSTKQIEKISIFQSSKVLSLMVFVVSALILIPVGIYLVFKGEEGGAFVFLIPFIYLGLSYIFYAITFWFYNFIARRMGGMEMDFKDEDKR